MICGTPLLYASRAGSDRSASRAGSDRRAQFRAELSALSSWQEKSRFLDEKLRQTTEKLGARNEKLLALRPDFADLEQAFWQVFARRLGCENPAETIKQERARLSNVLYLATMAGIVALTLFLVIQAHDNTPVTAVIVGAIALVGIAAMIGTPLARIARARKVAAVLARQQEPIWLTGGPIGLSSRGTIWPEGAKWWWEDRISLVFVRHIGAIRLRRTLSRTYLGRSLGVSDKH
jgi:hypothetical protein